MSEQEFARLLTEAVYTIKARENTTLAIVQDELGHLLNCKGGSCIEYWRRGHVPSDVQALETLAVTLLRRAGYDQVWLRNFLKHGQHPAPDAFCAEQVGAPAAGGNGRSPSLSVDAEPPAAAETVAAAGMTWRQVGAFIGRELGRFAPKSRLYLIPLLVGVIAVLFYRNLDTLHALAFPYVNQGWAVRVEEIDDINLVLVNDRLVDAVYGPFGMRWTNIDAWLYADQPNWVTFVNVNGSAYSLWEFGLMHDGAVVWRDAGSAQRPFNFGSVEMVALQPDGAFALLTPAEMLPAEPQPGVWQARVGADDFGLMLVNSMPAAVGYDSYFGVFDTFDISHYLHADQMNTVTVLAWNERESCYWDFELEHNGELVWQDEGVCQQEKGQTMYKTFHISADRNIITPESD